MTLQLVAPSSVSPPATDDITMHAASAGITRIVLSCPIRIVGGLAWHHEFEDLSCVRCGDIASPCIR